MLFGNMMCHDSVYAFEPRQLKSGSELNKICIILSVQPKFFNELSAHHC